MLVYWLIFIILSFFAFIELELKKENKNILYCLIFILFVFISGFRHDVGGDWSTYINYYDYFNNFVIENLLSLRILYHDIGYFFINYVSNKLSLTIYFVNLISSLIFCYGLFKYCSMFERRFLAILSSYPYLFVVVSMGYTRQAIAIGLSLLAIEKLHKSNNKGFFIFILLAFIFHKSSLILFIIYFGSIIVSPSFIVKNKIQSILFFLFIVYVLFQSSDLLINKVDHYFLYNYDSKGILYRISLLLVGTFITLIYLIINKNYSSQIRIFYFNCIFVILFFSISYFLLPEKGDAAIDRFLLYFLFFNIFSLAVIPELFKQYFPSTFIILSVVLYNFLILFIWLNFGIHAFAWLPYDNILF